MSLAGVRAPHLADEPKVFGPSKTIAFKPIH